MWSENWEIEMRKKKKKKRKTCVGERNIEMRKKNGDRNG